MDDKRYIAFVSSIASMIMAVIAIWLSLHHKQEADRMNLETRDLLMEVRTDAKSVATIALPEMQAYGEAMRSFIFTGSDIKRPTRPGVSTYDMPPLLVYLEHLVAQMKEGSGYSRQERDEALRLLNEALDEQSHQHPRFPRLLEEIVDVFASSDQDRALETIAKQFGDFIEKHDGILMSYLQHHGRRMFDRGRTGAEARESFMKYAELARGREAYPMALCALLVLSHSENRQEDLNSLITEFGSLRVADARRTFELLELRCDPFEVAQQPGAAIQDMSMKYRAFLEQYRTRLLEMLEQ